MNYNKIIESTDKCVYLGVPLHACTLNNDMSCTVRDFNRKVNNLLVDFSFVDSNTLSVCLYMEVNYFIYMIKIV